jgi:subfamily B ATP-binding cassette protein HlyB/CyaB
MLRLESANEKDETSSFDSGLYCLVLISQFFGIAADPEQIRHDLGRIEGRLSNDDILRAAKRLEFRVRRCRCKGSRLEKMPVPCIAEMQDGRYVILGGVAADKVLLRDPSEESLTELPREEFESAWTGYLILLTSRAQVAGAARRF